MNRHTIRLAICLGIVLLCLLPALSGQYEPLIGGVNYNETITDNYGTRVIQWNKWIDRFRLAAQKRLNRSPEYYALVHYGNLPIGTSASFTITVYRCGIVECSVWKTDDSRFGNLASQAFTSLQYSKYTQFPIGTHKDKIEFNQATMSVQEHGVFRHASGMNEEVQQ